MDRAKELLLQLFTTRKERVPIVLQLNNLNLHEHTSPFTLDKVLLTLSSTVDKRNIAHPDVHLLLFNCCLSTVCVSQFCPDGSSLGQRQHFQTELLKFIIDVIHMLSHDEENNTHLTLQGRISMHALLIAQTSLTMAMHDKNI